jgi:hypothetical protein
MTERARDGKGVGVEIERVKKKVGGGGVPVDLFFGLIRFFLDLVY